MDIAPFTVALAGGGAVLVRPVVPADRALLQAGFARLSERSRFFRFMRPIERLSDMELDVLTDLADARQRAVGALGLIGKDGAAEPEQAPAGIARYVRLPDRPDMAEVAVVVVDEYQGQGLGGLLLGALAKWAAAEGVVAFTAITHSENRAMLGLFLAVGAKVVGASGAERELEIPIYADPARYPATPTGDAFRTAYRLAAVA